MAWRYNPETQSMEEFDFVTGKVIDAECSTTTGQCKALPTKTESYTYQPYRPFDGVDKARWPTTFSTLMLFYFNPEWHKMTRWVMDKQDQARYDERRKYYGTSTWD